ncbi:putative F-box domain-containing protein [Helianthus anomalus]
MEDSDHQPTHSGALIGSNDDLLTEILLRLPVTSILLFKSVSKHWRLLLRHRHFTHRYDKISKSPGFFYS